MIKKTFTLLSFLLLISFTHLKADIIIQTTEVTYTPGTEFTIPFIIYGASEEGDPISSVYIVMTFDTSALQYMQFLNFNPLMPQNQWVVNGNNNLGVVAVNWFEPSFLTVALPDSSKLFDVKFTAEPGACPLTFTVYEFLGGEPDYLQIPTTPDHGYYASIQQVTFQVDMRDQDVSPDGVHLAGTFNGWSTTASPMVNDSVSKYSVSLPLICDSNYFYRFVNGDTEAGYEIVPPECGTPSGNIYNRSIDIPAGDTAMPQVCFSSCELCPPISDVTFRVDMRDQDVGPNGVHLSGSFNDWSPTATPMTLLNETTYTAALPLISESSFTYKFVNGNTMAGAETVPSECGVLYQGNYVRSVTTSLNDTLISEVCFSSCDTCPPQSLVSFRVDMSQQNISSNGVHVAGTFNNWNPAATLMNNLGNDIFGITLPVIEGTDIEYRFVNGNTEAGYEIVPSNCGVPASGGLYNRYLSVPEFDTTLMEVCFSNCSECLTIQSVTFKVDMSEEIVGQNGVHLAGSFNAFNPNATPMTNQGNDVYFVTLDFLEDELITYRFVNGNSADAFETVPEECGLDDGNGTLNRYFTVPDVQTTLDEVCFSSCEDCTQDPWEKNITFQVDMSNEDISGQGVYLAGTFNNWDPASNQLIHQGNNIYFTTLILDEDDVHQYRFINGNTSAGYETVPAECGFEGNSGGLERQITIPAVDSTLDLVCFSSCSACVVFEVSIRVDMMREIVSVNGVHLAGSFNNWDPDGLEMLSSGGTVYETTLQVYQGDTLFYRFVNGNQTPDLEIVPADCGWDYNGLELVRYIIPVSDTLMEDVCFGWCDPCDVGVSEGEEQALIGNIYPNPAGRYVKIPLSLPWPSEVMLDIANSTGHPLESHIFSFENGNQEITLPVSHLLPGMYFIKLLINSREYSTLNTYKILVIK
jgi:1,4-alpha-glucan branching enzyme